MFDGKANLTHPPGEISDSHLIFEYTSDQTWGNLKTVRSNRFYLNHDVANSNFGLVDDFHAKIDEFGP